MIGKDGPIANLTLVSGHPLLVPSATEAVRQWIYQPTLLNGEPVEVVTQIDVNFTLSQSKVIALPAVPAVEAVKAGFARQNQHQLAGEITQCLQPFRFGP